MLALYCGLEDWKWLLASGPQADTEVQHLVDSYAAQHPVNPDRRNQQSVAVHLMSLCASLEHGVPGTRLRQLIGTWAHRDYPQLAPAPEAYPLTAADIAHSAPQARSQLVTDMARATREAWSPHHGLVSKWLAGSARRLAVHDLGASPAHGKHSKIR